MRATYQEAMTVFGWLFRRRREREDPLLVAERERELREATRARHRAERDMALQRARIEYEIDKERATGGIPW